MKKLAILLSLVMVLGLAVNASAAVSINGEVKMTVTNADDKSFLDTYEIPDVKLNFTSQVNDNLKVTVQSNKLGLGNHWLDYKVGDITVKAGQYRFSHGASADKLATAYTGVGVNYPFAGGAVNAVLGLDKEEDSNTFGFNGKYALVDGLTVYGDFVMYTRGDGANSYAVAVDYDVAGFTVYGQYGKKNAWDKDAYVESDIQVVGASTAVSVFDLDLSYNVADEVLEFNVETTYDGLIVGADFTKAKDADLVIDGYLKVKF